jgi:activating signal cointegrator 1
MKAISMWQPHGSLLTTGAKPFETRGWKTNFRGPVLIHAALRLNRAEWDFFFRYAKFRWGVGPLFGVPLPDAEIWPSQMPKELERIDYDAIPRGAFIGMGELIDCIPTEKMTKNQCARSRGFGDFSDRRFAWEFADVKRFKTPIPAKGHQGFFYASVDLAGNELLPV